MIMELKTRRFIATTVNGFIATIYLAIFVCFMMLLLAVPGIVSSYMENDWWWLLALVTFPLSVGIIAAIAEHTTNAD